MADISKLDKNFAVEENIKKDGFEFYDAKRAPISLYGVFHDGNGYCRMPADVAKTVSEGVYYLSRNTAGGRVRFITDSPSVIIKAELPSICDMPHMPRTGSAGFDFYVREGERENFVQTLIPPKEQISYSGVGEFGSEKKERLITVNMPLYNSVNELYIGVKEGSVIKPAPDHAVSLPIVSYGSSITQGGCASRPGNSYQAILSRRYDANYINLGFSGNGKGEDEMRDHLASMKMSAFLLDYDHNAPTGEHLERTHRPIYEAVRRTNPDIPIIMMARPVFFDAEAGVAKRNEIIKKTYDYAVASGDENTYFIPSHELCEYCRDNGTVDRTHPNDLGFFSMALAIFKYLDKYFEVKAQ